MDIEHADFTSSYVESADYDTETGDLTVTFVRNGDSYTYPHVPAATWQALQSATSPGRYLREELTGRS